MQLESQVGVATSYLASRDTRSVESSQNSDQMSNLIQNLNLLLTRLSGISECFSNQTKTPAVNVYTFPCCPPHKNPVSDSATQTTKDGDHVPLSKRTAPLAEDCSHGEAPQDLSTHSEEILTCTVCNGTHQSSTQLDEHMEFAHDCHLHPPAGRPESEVNGESCDYCSNVFPTQELLQVHISINHATDYIHCNSCMLRFQTKQKQEEHAQACHRALPVTPTQSATCPPATGSRTLSSSILHSSVQSASTSSQSEQL